MSGIDATYTPRLYRCEECRCILGVVLRNRNHVRRLFVFRKWHLNEDSLPSAVTMIQEAEHPTRKHSIYNVHNMDQGAVECGQCHAVQEWKMSPEALDDLHQRRGMVTYAKP